VPCGPAAPGCHALYVKDNKQSKRAAVLRARLDLSRLAINSGVRRFVLGSLNLNGIYLDRLSRTFTLQGVFATPQAAVNGLRTEGTRVPFRNLKAWPHTHRS